MEKLFFELLQVAIGKRQRLSVIPTNEEWQLLYEMAKKQSLLGVTFYAIQKNNIQLDKKLLLQWFSVSEKIRQNNQRANEAAVKLTQFFLENGFRTCILKGQGNAITYPDPYIRTSGDIDIWVEGGQSAVLNFVRKYVSEADFCYNHIEFKKINGIETEVHYRPLFMNNMIHNKRMQHWFCRVADEQFRHKIEFPDGAGKACVPTNDFNRIYQMAHIAKHFFCEGIGFRQIVDYYFVLQQGFTAEERLYDERQLKHLGLYKIATAVMFVLKKTLDLEPDLMIVPADERLGRFLLDELLQSGNFGQHDSRVAHKQGQFAKNIQRLKRDFRLVRYFPSECLWEPVFRWYHFFWRIRHKK